MTEIVQSITSLPEVLEGRQISNSEVTSWLTCRRQYKYAHNLNLAEKVTSSPLARGSLGHLAFEYYIVARIAGMNHEQAMVEGGKAFTEALLAKQDVGLVLETQGLWTRYMGYHEGWPNWELLGAEQKLTLKVTDTITIPMRYDFMYKDLTSGKIYVGDFKFTYDFWSEDDHDLNGQMPKYIAIMRANGLNVHGGVLEEIRTRKLGAEKSADQRNLWKRTIYMPSNAKQKNMLKQHVAASFEIMEYRESTPEVQAAKEIPVLNKHGACKYCNFKDLCTSELDGGDITYAISTNYVQNTYGYNNSTTDEIKELL